jgi:hypothetical protein
MIVSLICNYSPCSIMLYVFGDCSVSFLGLTTVEIDPQRSDVAAEVQRALEVLRRADIRARPRVRSLEMKGLIQVADPDAERAVNLLRAANMRAAVRPS